MKCNAIIFDFDGVLYDSERIHLQACNQVFHSLGFTIPEEEYFQYYVGLSDDEMFNLILDNKNISYTADQAKTLRINKIHAYQSIINQSDSLAGVCGIKKFLESNFSRISNFAICSGATRTEIDATLKKLEHGELIKYFKHIVTIDDLEKGKPSPEGYLLTAQRLGALPQFCLVIEDTPVGIAAAKNAGMKVVALTTTHPSSVLKDADFIADTYEEINCWLAS